MKLTIVDGDLLDQNVDVIVNAWNRNIIPWWLLLPQGVSGAIKRRGGTGPFKELRKHGSIPLGDAVLTSAGRLPFKGVIQESRQRRGAAALESRSRCARAGLDRLDESAVDDCRVGGGARQRQLRQAVWRGELAADDCR